jgi:hypothetical protein
VKWQLQPLGNRPGHQIWSITVMWSPMRRCNAWSYFYLPQWIISKVFFQITFSESTYDNNILVWSNSQNQKLSKKLKITFMVPMIWSISIENHLMSTANCFGIMLNLFFFFMTRNPFKTGPLRVPTHVKYYSTRIE